MNLDINLIGTSTGLLKINWGFMKLTIGPDVLTFLHKSTLICRSMAVGRCLHTPHITG